MSKRILESIKRAIREREYDLTRHAVEELAEDGLTILDVEHAILNGHITKIETNEPRGPKYTIRGFAEDGKVRVGTVGRFKETGIYLIITVYEVSESET